MYYNILAQKDYQEHSQLKKVIKLLREFMVIDAIYFSKHFGKPSHIGIITVIVGKNSPHLCEDICEYSWKLFKSHPEFAFAIFDRFWVKEELEDCNPFLIMNCAESQLVYSDTNHKENIIDIKKIDIKQLIKKSKKRFQIFTSPCLIIDRDLRYFRNRNLLMAAYNMHQQFRYLFLSVSWFLTGEWTYEQSLKEQLNHLHLFCSELGNAFSPEKKEEWFVLKQLDNSCQAIQRDKEIEPISAETVELAYVKLNWVKSEVRRIFQDYIEKTKKIIEDHGNK